MKKDNPLKRFAIPSLFLLLAFSPLFGNLQIREQRPKKQSQVIELDQELMGGGAFGAVIFNNLTSSGLLKLTGTTVKHKLHVEGSLLTQAALLNAVEVVGEANLKNTNIAQAMQVVGTLRAEKSTFKGPLTLDGVKVSFIGSQIASLNVLKDSSFKGHQIIELKQKTLVDGPIVFEGGNGEVHCYPGSYVLGLITGGKLIKKN
jgi:hypothetical protein